MKSLLRFSSLLACAALAVLVTSVHAKQGATDPIPGTSNGATNTKSGGTKGGGGGGGGKKSSTVVTLPPAPPPAPFVAKPLTFTSSGPLNGVTPVCTGDYHIDPYYPTLSLMTVNVETTSVNVPDGTALYVTVSGTGGTLYPFTSNVIVISGQIGLCSYSVYVTPGTVITSVDITTAAGVTIASGN
ncbi:MAG: hypothetical protein JNN01_18080 [Opitutaceae bacterium]|nr:hypothetical protein [Opitutaceae bacterium]